MPYVTSLFLLYFILGPGATANGAGQWRPVNHFNWPTHHGPGCPWWPRSNHHASPCIWDTGFAAGEWYEKVFRQYQNRGF